MREEIYDLPAKLDDPYAVSLHLQQRFETISRYYEEHDRPDGVGFGLNYHHIDKFDMVKKRYNELIDLGLPKETGCSVLELLEMNSAELRHLIKRAREKSAERNKALDEAKKAANGDGGNNVSNRKRQKPKRR